MLDQVLERLRYLHYSIRTEEANVHWVRAFVHFHHLRHPRAMGAQEVQAFLSWSVVERHVSVSTHRQALAALQLRAKDLDFERRVFVVRCGKGGKDRLVMLPAALVPSPKAQLQRARGGGRCGAQPAGRTASGLRHSKAAAAMGCSLHAPELRRAALPQQLQLPHRRVAS
jgi:integrase